MRAPAVHRRDRQPVHIHPGIARIGALQEPGQREPRRDDRRHVFETVHGDVDLATPERVLELLEEQTFAAIDASDTSCLLSPLVLMVTISGR